MRSGGRRERHLGTNIGGERDERRELGGDQGCWVVVCWGRRWVEKGLWVLVWGCWGYCELGVVRESRVVKWEGWEGMPKVGVEERYCGGWYAEKVLECGVHGIGG